MYAIYRHISMQVAVLNITSLEKMEFMQFFLSSGILLPFFSFN